jgi:ABC-2 type transport system permease protein
VLNRILAVVRKEFVQMRRDKGTFAIMLIIPLIQLTLFGSAINTDVKHIKMAVLDYSRSEESRLLVQAFTNNEYFELESMVESPAQVTELINRGIVKVGLVIPSDFARDLDRGRRAQLQLLVDASDPQVAASTLGYANNIASQSVGRILGKPVIPPLDVQIRAWFNPDLVSANHIVPGLIGVILAMTMTSVTSMAIVRERETGTLDQLETTPLTPFELMVGKIVPYILVGYVQVTVALAVGHWIFDVPIRGSVGLLYALSSLQIIVYLCLGLLLSTVAKTQQQANQMSMLVFLPNMILSGFMFPVEGMPQWAQALSHLVPLTYFLQIVRGIVMKGLGIEYLWQFILPMLVILGLLLSLAVVRFGRKA